MKSGIVSLFVALVGRNAWAGTTPDTGSDSDNTGDTTGTDASGTDGSDTGSDLGSDTDSDTDAPTETDVASETDTATDTDTDTSTETDLVGFTASQIAGDDGGIACSQGLAPGSVLLAFAAVFVAYLIRTTRI